MNRFVWVQFSSAVLARLVTTSTSQAVVLNSSPFSFGYGFAGLSGSSWNDSETASVNTPTTQGLFSFSPAPKGDRFSGDGVVFPNRVLTDQSADLTATGGLKGTFTTSPPALAAGLRWRIHYGANHVALAILAVPEPGTCLLLLTGAIASLLSRRRAQP